MIPIPIALGVLTLALGSAAGLYYPVAVNLGLLLIFYSSMSTATNFIQRIAEKVEKRPLDSIGISYTTQVTKIWCVLFLLNAAVSSFLAWQQMLDAWAFYNGVLAYLLMTILFFVEWALRSRIQQKMRRTADATLRHINRAGP